MGVDAEGGEGGTAPTAEGGAASDAAAGGGAAVIAAGGSRALQMRRDADSVDLNETVDALLERFTAFELRVPGLCPPDAVHSNLRTKRWQWVKEAVRGLKAADKDLIKEMCGELLKYQGRRADLVASWGERDHASTRLLGHRTWRLLEEARARAANEDLAM